MNQRELFLRHVGQTSPAPIAISVSHAEGVYLYDNDGKQYLDLIGGISVCSTGHRHPRVIDAIHRQTEKYLHVLVYGELMQSPQIDYAAALARSLPAPLDSVYFTNSGAEATEGAMKLAKRATGRPRFVAFEHSYHGSTQGALSIMGDEYWRNAFRPLLPDVLHLRYNSFEDLELIDARVAGVIAETVQAENGVREPAEAPDADTNWLKALRHKCTETGSLLILDEIQTGCGRTGTCWGFQKYGVVPDIVLSGKALGGGLPLGAFIAARSMMDLLTNAPVLGHITTFGGHPLSCAAGLAAWNVLLDENLMAGVAGKAALFRDKLKHPAIRAVRTAGLLIAVEFDNFEFNKKVVDACLERGLLTDWFLFASNCLRIAPPLTIPVAEIESACAIIISVLDSQAAGGRLPAD